MTRKTAAEMQIEFLKKLKAGTEPDSGSEKRPQNSGKDAPAHSASLSPRGSAGKETRPISRVPDKMAVRLPSVKVGKAVLQSLKSKNRQRKVFRDQAAMVHWALEVADSIPFACARLDEEAKKEFFQAARLWLSQRGVRDE